jgi:hypothetical protein
MAKSELPPRVISDRKDPSRSINRHRMPASSRNFLDILEFLDLGRKWYDFALYPEPVVLGIAPAEYLALLA